MMHALGMAAPFEFVGNPTVMPTVPTPVPLVTLLDALDVEEPDESEPSALVTQLLAAPPVPSVPEPSAPPAPPARPPPQKFSNDGTGDSNRCRNVWEKIMKAKLGQAQWKALIDRHGLDKHLPIRLARRYAIEYQVALPEPCDLREVQYMHEDVPEAKWRVPTACKGFERQIREHGFCPTNLCETCRALSAKDAKIAERRRLAAMAADPSPAPTTDAAARELDALQVLKAPIDQLLSGVEREAADAKETKPAAKEADDDTMAHEATKAAQQQGTAPAPSYEFVLSEMEQIVHGFERDSESVTESSSEAGSLESEMAEIVDGLERALAETPELMSTTEAHPISTPELPTSPQVTTPSRKRSSWEGRGDDGGRPMSRARCGECVHDGQTAKAAVGSHPDDLHSLGLYSDLGFGVGLDSVRFGLEPVGPDYLAEAMDIGVGSSSFGSSSGPATGKCQPVVGGRSLGEHAAIVGDDHWMWLAEDY